MRHDRPGHFWLIERYRRLSYDAAQIAERYEEHVEDVVVNVFYALALQALATARHRARRTSTRERAQRAIDALLSRCYDERSGLFFDLAGQRRAADAASRRGPRWRRWRSASFPRMSAGGWSRSICWIRAATVTAYGIPSVAIEEPSFNPSFSAWRCWRGPAWMNTAWLLVPAMRELGYVQEAERIVARSCARSTATAFASTTTRSAAAGWRPAASGSRRCSSIFSQCAESGRRSRIRRPAHCAMMEP